MADKKRYRPARNNKILKAAATDNVPIALFWVTREKSDHAIMYGEKSGLGASSDNTGFLGCSGLYASSWTAALCSQKSPAQYCLLALTHMSAKTIKLRMRYRNLRIKENFLSKQAQDSRLRPGSSSTLLSEPVRSRWIFVICLQVVCWTHRVRQIFILNARVNHPG